MRKNAQKYAKRPKNAQKYAKIRDFLPSGACLESKWMILMQKTRFVLKKRDF